MLILLITLYALGCVMSYFWAVEDTNGDEVGNWMVIGLWPFAILLLILIRLIDLIKNRFSSPKQ